MEITLEELKVLILKYLQSNRLIEVKNPQERQGNSKLWEKDIEEFFVQQGFRFRRNDSESPDFEDPLNFDVKTVRIDRKTKTFTVAPLTEIQAETGVLPYRIVVLIWRYNATTGHGVPVDAIVVPKNARSVLKNWSYKGIQVKSGVSDDMIRRMGVLSSR